MAIMWNINAETRETLCTPCFFLECECQHWTSGIVCLFVCLLSCLFDAFLFICLFAFLFAIWKSRRQVKLHPEVSGRLGRAERVQCDSGGLGTTVTKTLLTNKSLSVRGGTINLLSKLSPWIRVLNHFIPSKKPAIVINFFRILLR